MSRKMYTAERIAQILINLHNDNYLDTDVKEDWDETEADITNDNFPPPVDSTADSDEEMEPLEPEALNDSEEDQSHKHAPESCQGNNEDGDNNTKNENGAIPTTMNYEANQKQEFNLPQRPIKNHFSDCTGEGHYFLKLVDVEI